MAENSLPHFELHPAWEAVARRLTDDERWKLRAFGKPGGYRDDEIAFAMALGGFLDDLVVIERREDGVPKAYAFPDRWVRVYRETKRYGRQGRPVLKCNRWLIERHFTDGERLRKLMEEYKHRHAQEVGYELATPERSARVVIHRERVRRGLNILHKNHLRFAHR